MKIILYTTHCPKCEILEEKLKNKDIKYQEVNDIELMLKKGYMSVPVVECDGKVYQFAEANKLINSL